MHRACPSAISAFAAVVLAASSLSAQQIGAADGRDLPPIDRDRVQVGAMAPDFTLPVYRGGLFTLSDLRGSKNVVLIFYRGWWCPYCMAQLTELRHLLDDELKSDTQLIVVSIDGDEGNGRAFERIARDDGIEPDYMFLSDSESSVIGRYGILNPDGGRRGAIPHPSAYVIDKQGIVRWKDIQTDYRIRPSNEQVRAGLEAARRAESD